MCREPESRGRGRVAIIGGGAAGLAAAGYLACAGYEIDIYDKLPMLGGLMMFAIPTLRVPRDSVIEGVEDLKTRFSIKIFTRVKVFADGAERRDEGDEFVERVEPLSRIIESYDAVLIATGIWRSRKLGIEGEDSRGVFTALEFLYHVRAYEHGLIDRAPECGKKVVVVGAGLSAVDAAEQALELGAEEVYLVYRRTIREAPAGEYEIRRLIREGVKWIELAQPTKIVARNGRVVGVEFVRMRLGEPDETGRPRPIPVPGTEFVLEADTVIVAVGEMPTPPIEKEFMGISLDKRGRIVVDERMRTGNEKVFAAGDVVTGPSMIGRAFGSGLRAARFLDEYLRLR